MSERLDALVAARRRAEMLARMRALAQAQPQAPSALRIERVTPAERCDICNATIPDDHRHLLHLSERRIVCACEACWALHSGDAEYRPAGTRTVWLDSLDLDDELWGTFQIPIGLAFFMRSSSSSISLGVVAFYPSPAGATESELSLDAWHAVVARNPVLGELEPDAEALIVNRLAEPHQYVIAPIDDCYRLVGLIKSRWEGISGGDGLERAVPAFFDELRARVGSRPGAVR